MKSIVVSIAVAAGLMIAGSAMAADMPATAKGCGACHNQTTDVKKVGPGWVAVAKKYAGDHDAVSKISANITKGGKFGWNFGMMPPKGGNAKLTEAQVTELATFIAGLK